MKDVQSVRKGKTKWKWKALSYVLLFVTQWAVYCIVHGILQARRILEGVAVPFSRESSQPRDRTQVSLIAGGFFTSWATREAQREGRRGCNQRHLDPSACCPSPHQMGGLRRGSGPTSCWLWAQGNPRLGRVSLRCWQRARARPQLEGGKTRSSLKLEADFPSRSWSFTGAL